MIRAWKRTKSSDWIVKPINSAAPLEEELELEELLLEEEEDEEEELLELEELDDELLGIMTIPVDDELLLEEDEELLFIQRLQLVHLHFF